MTPGRGCLAILLLGFAVEAWAHHSFVGQYDPAKLVTMTGTVTKVEWTNPHAFFYIDVEDSDNGVTNWAVAKTVTFGDGRVVNAGSSSNLTNTR